MHFQVNKTRADAVSCNDCREKELEGTRRSPLVAFVVTAYKSVVAPKMAVLVTPHYVYYLIYALFGCFMSSGVARNTLCLTVTNCHDKQRRMAGKDCRVDLTNPISTSTLLPHIE